MNTHIPASAQAHGYGRGELPSVAKTAPGGLCWRIRVRGRRRAGAIGVRDVVAKSMIDGVGGSVDVIVVVYCPCRGTR